MKKFIFYAIKSVAQYCHTFSCRYHAGFSSFFRTDTVAKKLVSFGVLLLLMFSPTFAYSQLVGSSAVKGNFGIEGDVYANWLQFPNIAVPPVDITTPAAGTDDWFVDALYTGSGRGVIDQSMPYPIIDNTAFERRQSITTPTAPFPYPVVPAVGPPWTGSYLWLDAVYGRDTYVKGGGAETSYFAGSGDKNSDNPSTWSIGLSGSVPQKDDIIDVYAHLRGEGIRIPDADPRPFTTLWAYAAASVAVTNGNKHIDFEFFRTEVTLANLGTPGSTGPDGGRTAWTFNPDGSVAIPGTIIISVDYTNGGTVPQVRIRVWMDETVFNNYNNSALFRPFTIDKATAFEKGTDSGTYGYAAILENVGATDIWGRVNDTDPTQGPPWGTFAGVGPDGTPNYQELQFIEIGINLTAFGLDARGTQDPCSNILGSLMVKTRSSGGGPNEGAFGSELKDFAGPFLFGNTGNPPEPTVTNKTACENLATGSATVDLTAGANGGGGTLSYYTSFVNDVYSGLIATPAAFSAPVGVTTIYARSESLSNPGCFGATSFTVTVTDNPDITVQNLTACETGVSGAASMDLTGAILTNPDGGVITFHNSLADAQNETNAVASPTSVTVASSPRTFYVRAEAGVCYSTASFTVSVTDNPDIAVQNLSACETGATGAATFDLDDGVTGADGGTISFHTSLADADAGSNAIAGKDTYSASNGLTTIWVRSANGLCYGTSSFTITVNPNPELSIHNPEPVCEGTAVDLTAAAVTSGSTLEGGSLSYWTDAAATIPLDTPSAVMAGTYYIKVLTTSGCMDIEPVMVTDQPCGGPLCTYTQGYYGNLGGMSCADGKQFTTMGLIEKALLSYGGTMRIGLPATLELPARSILISNTDEDKNAIIAVLPGGGSSYALSVGEPHLSALPSSYLKKGVLNNTLLAQTITLGLNLGIDSQLGDFVLQAGTLATAAPEGGCGFDTPMPRSCSAEGYAPVINEYQYFTIPPVVDLLPVKTVQGLFDMANIALGGGALPEGVSLSALASAVDVVNNAFDGCRISMGYDQTPLACLTSSPQDFVAFEVPIVNNTLTVKYKFSYETDVLIEVFDTNYNKVCSLTDSNSYLDKEIVLNCNFNTGTQKVYIVRLTTRLGHDEKKVMSSY